MFRPRCGVCRGFRGRSIIAGVSGIGGTAVCVTLNAVMPVAVLLSVFVVVVFVVVLVVDFVVVAVDVYDVFVSVMAVGW